MKITGTHYDITHSVETQSDDLTCVEFFDLCRKLAVAMGFHESSIDSVFGDDVAPDTDDWGDD